MIDKTQATYFIEDNQQHVQYGVLDLVFNKAYNTIDIWYKGSDLVIYADGSVMGNTNHLAKTAKTDVARLLRNYGFGNNVDGYQLMGKQLLNKFAN